MIHDFLLHIGFRYNKNKFNEDIYNIRLNSLHKSFLYLISNTNYYRTLKSFTDYCDENPSEYLNVKFSGNYVYIIGSIVGGDVEIKIDTFVNYFKQDIREIQLNKIGI